MEQEKCSLRCLTSFKRQAKQVAGVNCLIRRPRCRSANSKSHAALCLAQTDGAGAAARRANEQTAASQAHGTNSLSSVSNSGSGIACTSTEPLYFPAYTCLRAAPLAVLPPPSTFLTICVRTSRADLADLVLVSERAAQSACRCFIPMNT